MGDRPHKSSRVSERSTQSHIVMNGRRTLVFTLKLFFSTSVLELGHLISSSLTLGVGLTAPTSLES